MFFNERKNLKFKNTAGFTPLEITPRSSTDVGLRFRIIPARFILFRNKFLTGFNAPREFLTGFTLIELLVSIAIIVALSGLILANYHSANKRSELVNAAQKLASDIRLAQSYAMGQKDFNGEQSPGGWGVYFNKIASPTSYLIFADKDDNDWYEAGEEFQIVTLPAGIKIGYIEAGEWGEEETDEVPIIFTPPNPDVSTNSGIKLTDGETSKTVHVNVFGLVEVID